MYKVREKRQSFLQSSEGKEDQASLFKKLEIRVLIREATRKDYLRVAELINRTNQFNLCGSRATVADLSAWASSGKRIIIADASDKFGPMGTICAVVLEASPGRVSIPVFVLSCRVFGYGIEVAVLNHAKGLAMELGESDLIVGAYKETAYNQPCRTFYPGNGFTWDGIAWTYRGRANARNPEWLSISSGAP
jgi:FkbH-like protein